MKLQWTLKWHSNCDTNLTQNSRYCEHYKEGLMFIYYSECMHTLQSNLADNQQLTPFTHFIGSVQSICAMPEFLRWGHHRPAERSSAVAKWLAAWFFGLGLGIFFPDHPNREQLPTDAFWTSFFVNAGAVLAHEPLLPHPSSRLRSWWWTGRPLQPLATWILIEMMTCR